MFVKMLYVINTLYYYFLLEKETFIENRENYHNFCVICLLTSVFIYLVISVSQVSVWGVYRNTEIVSCIS